MVDILESIYSFTVLIRKLCWSIWGVRIFGIGVNTEYTDEMSGFLFFKKTFFKKHLATPVVCLLTLR